MLLQEDKDILCTTVLLVLNQDCCFPSQDSLEIFPSHVIAVSTYRCLRKRQMLAVPADGEPTGSKVTRCQDSSFLTYLNLAPTCLRGTSGGMSSLVNMEDKAGTQNICQPDCWRRSLRALLSQRGETGGFRVQLFLPQGARLHLLK